MWFMKEKISLPFGPPEVMVSDNAACFSTGLVQSLVAEWVTQCNKVLTYAPISNSRLERMVDTIKKAVARVAVSESEVWDAAVPGAAFGYCRRPTRCGPSSFQLLYSVESRILKSD